MTKYVARWKIDPSFRCPSQRRDVAPNSIRLLILQAERGPEKFPGFG